MTLCTKFQFTTQTNKQGICKEKNLFFFYTKAIQLSLTNHYFHPYRILNAVKTYHKLVQKVSALLSIVALHGCFDILKLTT